jgi:hypothetical protein
MSGSEYTKTPNYNLYLPVPNADNDVWGDHLNANTTTLDTLIKSVADKSGVTSFNTRSGVVTLNNTDVITVLPSSGALPTMDSTASAGSSTAWSRSDHVHPTDTSRYAASNPSGYQTAAQVTTTLAPYAPLASPTFTGNPTAPTPAVSDSDTSIATTAFVTTAVAAGTQPGNVGRNLLHNGMMRIAQRGAGPFSVTGYTLDRWKLTVVTDVAAITQIATTDSGRTAVGDEEFTVALKNAFTGSASAGAMNYIQQPIENVRRLAGKTVTVSFWANGDRALNLGINIFQSFGTGGSPSAGVWATPTVAAIPGTAWARYTKTIAVPSIIGKTLGTNGDDYTALTFFYSAAAGNSSVTGVTGPQTGTFNIWGAQLEIGSAATQLEKPDPRLDLGNCQRFYTTQGAFIAGYGLTSNTIGTSVYLSVAMRATPTVALVSNVSTNTSALSTGPSANGTSIYGIVVATGAWAINTNVQFSADL